MALHEFSATDGPFSNIHGLNKDMRPVEFSRLAVNSLPITRPTESNSINISSMPLAGNNLD